MFSSRFQNERNDKKCIFDYFNCYQPDNIVTEAVDGCVKPIYSFYYKPD